MGGHLEVVQWAREHDIPWNTTGRWYTMSKQSDTGNTGTLWANSHAGWPRLFGLLRGTVLRLHRRQAVHQDVGSTVEFEGTV